MCLTFSYGYRNKRLHFVLEQESETFKGFFLYVMRQISTIMYTRGGFAVLKQTQGPTKMTRLNLCVGKFFYGCHCTQLSHFKYKHCTF